MKTSWNETRRIERYLTMKMGPGESLLFQAQLLIQPSLREALFWQQKTYDLLRLYHHKKVKTKLEEIHQQLFADPEKKEFQEQIRELFTS